MEDLEKRKEYVLKHWHLVSEPTKELLRAIGIDGDKVNQNTLRQHSSSQRLLTEIKL